MYSLTFTRRRHHQIRQSSRKLRYDQRICDWDISIVAGYCWSTFQKRPAALRENHISLTIVTATLPSSLSSGHLPCLIARTSCLDWLEPEKKNIALHHTPEHRMCRTSGNRKFVICQDSSSTSVLYVSQYYRKQKTFVFRWATTRPIVRIIPILHFPSLTHGTGKTTARLPFCSVLKALAMRRQVSKRNLCLP